MEQGITENDTAERFERLEIKLAYMEDFMRKIQDVTLEQGKAIDGLKAENKALRQKLVEMSEDRRDAPADARPPHY